MVKMFKSCAEQLYDLIENDDVLHIPTIDITHEYIHNGKVYYINNKRSYSTNNTVDFIFKTFNYNIHLVYTNIGTTYTMSMYQVAPVSSTTEFNLINRNFNFGSQVSGSTNNICRIYKNSDVNINTYTLLTEDLINLQLVASSSNKFSLELGAKEERILKKNSTYVIRILSDANSNIICNRFDFYYK